MSSLNIFNFFRNLWYLSVHNQADVFVLQELKSRPGEMRPRILENMVLVSRKHKVDVERALAAFMEICSNEVEYSF